MTDNRCRKLLAMDLDGTAVADNYQMGELTKAAILKARKAGYVTAFVTGRRDVDMRSLDKESHCVDYLILNNGGKIVRCCDGQVLYNRKICKEDCRSLLEYCLQYNLELHVCDGMFWAVNILTDDTLEYAQELGMVPGGYKCAEEIDIKNGLEGFMAMRDWERVGHYIDSHMPDVTYTLSEPDCIDIMASGISKWDGVKRLAEIETVAKEHIIAVGNFYNDIDMITHAAIGVAVANAPEDVKEAADYVTHRTNNEDAVAEVVERFCGILDG